ncbi:MAG TPA: hypothetical protein PLC59_00195 [Bacteroidales bacterium]|nr:hypothetical protein [Bacteroidales bacterium]HQI44483.1 hypothetical protein [Bacteroidales bacterium]
MAVKSKRDPMTNTGNRVIDVMIDGIIDNHTAKQIGQVIKRIKKELCSRCK